MMAKTRWFVATLLVLSLVVCGCNLLIGSLICNVSIGQTQGIIAQNVVSFGPGLLTLPDGNLLTAYPDAPGIVIKLSTDKGATWEPNSVIYISDSSADALALLPNGSLFLSTSVVPASGIGTPAYAIGTIGTGDAITWSAWVFISTPESIYSCWAMSPVVYLGNGNLLWPVWCYNDPAGDLPGSSTVLLSTDGGLTWPKQVVVGNSITDGRDYDESAAVIYPNGNIVMIIRQTIWGETDRYGSYWRSESTDGGNTWSAPSEVVKSVYIGRPTLALLPSGGLVLMGRALVAGNSVTGFGTSWDEGLTFSVFTSLGVGDPGTDNYDAMSLLQDGSIAVVTVHNNSGTGLNNIYYRNLIDLCSSRVGTSEHASCLRSVWLK